jgi:hypothetical protein
MTEKIGHMKLTAVTEHEDGDLKMEDLFPVSWRALRDEE